MLEILTQQKLFEFFVTDIPQSLALVFLFFTLLDVKFKIKSFYAISLGYAVLPYIVTPLVDNGVHTLISVFALILIAIIWGKANRIKAILYAIISFCIAILSELLSIGIFSLYRLNFDVLDNDAFLKAISGISSISILFIVCSIIWYIKQKNKGKNQDVTI